jgi:hypothetical protein
MYLATIYCLPFLRDSIVKVNINHLKKFYNYFINTFVLLFIITALIEGKAVYEEMAGGRYYYNGFVISHQFSYFSVLFGFILLKNKQNLKASIVFILALSVGNRISYLLLISVFYLYVENKYDKGFLGNKLLRAVSFVVLLLLILFVVMLCINTSWGTVSNLLIEDDYRDFTSGRSLFWYNGLDKLLKLNFFSFNSWFGFGPDSVEVLASKLYDNHFWMHNDFMQIWYCYGFVGLALYSHGLYLLVKEFKTLSILWPILLTSMLNGFYTYGALQIFIMLIYIYIVKVHFSKKNIFLTKRNQIEYVPRLVK